MQNHLAITSFQSTKLSSANTKWALCFCVWLNATQVFCRALNKSLNKLFLSNMLLFVRLSNRHTRICLGICLVEAAQLSFIVFTGIHLNWVAALHHKWARKKANNNDRPLEIICCLLGKLFNPKTYYLQKHLLNHFCFALWNTLMFLLVIKFLACNTAVVYRLQEKGKDENRETQNRCYY